MISVMPQSAGGRTAGYSELALRVNSGWAAQTVAKDVTKSSRPPLLEAYPVLPQLGVEVVFPAVEVQVQAAPVCPRHDLSNTGKAKVCG